MGGYGSESSNNSPPNFALISSHTTSTETNATYPTSGTISSTISAISSGGTGIILNALDENVRLQKDVNKFTELAFEGAKKYKQLGVDVPEWKLSRLAEKVTVGRSAISTVSSVSKATGKILPGVGFAVDYVVDRSLHPEHSRDRSALPAFGGVVSGTGGTALLTNILAGSSATHAAPIVGGIVIGWGTSKVIGGVMDGSIDRYFQNLNELRHENMVDPNGNNCLY
jgi:hypothetical protein